MLLKKRIQKIMSRLWKKDPDDSEAYTITWRGTDSGVQYALEDTESISASVWTLSAELNEESSSFDATTSTILISGGTAGERYTVTNTVTIDSGRVLSRSVYVAVLELWVN